MEQRQTRKSVKAAALLIFLTIVGFCLDHDILNKIIFFNHDDSLNGNYNTIPKAQDIPKPSENTRLHSIPKMNAKTSNHKTTQDEYPSNEPAFSNDIHTSIRKLHSTQYTDRRIHLEPNETIEIVLSDEILDAKIDVTIRSEDGGVLNGKSLSPGISFESGKVPASFFYTVGRHRGLYVVSILYGQNIQRLEFWAGPPLPLAKPGPKKIIQPPEGVQ